MSSIIFINSHRAKSGFLEGNRLPEGYVLTARFFDCGVLDRTRTLDHGFDYKTLEPIPSEQPDVRMSFAEVCDLVADRILEEAVSGKRSVDVLWSGGIDSTNALISLVTRNERRERPAEIRVLLTLDSVDEYPLFFKDHIWGKLNYIPVTAPIVKYVGKDALIVTGEHGDQLFGSDKLLRHIENGLAYLPYEISMPIHLMDKFRNIKKVDKVLTYLAPLIEACPVKIESTMDLFWWLNFTIKWQQVSLRLAVFSPANAARLYSRFRHFFNAPEFQLWSISGHEAKITGTLQSYKLPSKEIIYQFTGDAAYYKNKSKLPSLKNVIIDRKKQGDERYRVYMKEDFVPVIESFHRQLKNKISKNISE